MELLLRGAYLEIFPDLRAAAERGLEQALNRGRLEAQQATVCLRNSGGSRWMCIIGIRARGAGRITAQATAPLPSTAVEEAVRKLTRAVVRVSASKPKSRRSRRSIEVLPQWGGRRLSLT